MKLAFMKKSRVLYVDSFLAVSFKNIKTAAKGYRQVENSRNVLFKLKSIIALSFSIFGSPRGR